MVRKRREPQMKGKRENAAKSLPRVSRRGPGWEVRKIRLAEVIVPKHRARRLRDVTSLVESIAQSGLIEPIVVRRLPDGRLVLVCGAHRLEAHRQLNRDKILARIIEVSDLEAELIELDENLERTALTVLERGEHLRRRKEVYEALHPEACQHARGGHAKAAAEAATEMISVAPAFTSDAASRLGTSERSIREEIRIATELAPEAAKVLRGTPLEDEKVRLMQLTRLPRDQQMPVARLLVERRTKSVKSAVVILESGADKAEKENKPQRRKDRDIKARVREVAQPLREARKRLDRLVRDIEPALVQGAQAISEEIEALEKKFAALMRSVSAPTPKTASLDQAQAAAISREMDLPVVSTPEGVVGNDKHAPTMNGAGGEAPTPRGPSRAGPPSVSSLSPLPRASMVSASAPSKAPTHTPTAEEVEAEIEQILADYKSGALRLPFQGQARIWQTNWPRYVKEEASKKFIARLDVLRAAEWAARRSGASAGAPPAAPDGAAPSRIGTRTGQSQESLPARPEASASQGSSTPGMGEFARAVALAQDMCWGPSIGTLSLPSDALTRAAELAWVNTS